MDLPIEHSDFPVRYVNVYQRVMDPQVTMAFITQMIIHDLDDLGLPLHFWKLSKSAGVLAD